MRIQNNYSYYGYGGIGIGLGNILAVVISWSVNHSVLWAIIQGFFGWLYVLYYLITRAF